MAKINKLQKSGVTIYPATIPQAVIDSETGKTQKELNSELLKEKAVLVKDNSLEVTSISKKYQTEALALADKNPIDTTTSLPLTVGQFVSIVNDEDKNGIYRIGSISVDGTMSLELQGKLGDLSEYANHGYESNPKTLKEVDYSIEKRIGFTQLFDKSLVLNSRKVDEFTGNISQVNDVSCSNKIFLDSSETNIFLSLEPFTVMTLAFYDANETPIPPLDNLRGIAGQLYRVNGSGNYEIPPNAVAVAFNVEWGQGNRDTVMLEYCDPDTTEPSAYQEYSSTAFEYVDLRKEEILEKIDDNLAQLAGDVSEQVNGLNTQIERAYMSLYDLEGTNLNYDVLEGYWDTSFGNFVESSTARTTDKIPVTPGSKIKTNNIYPTDPEIFSVIYWNSAGAFLRRETIEKNAEGAYFTVPDGVHFISSNLYIGSANAWDFTDLYFKEIDFNGEYKTDYVKELLNFKREFSTDQIQELLNFKDSVESQLEPSEVYINLSDFIDPAKTHSECIEDALAFASIFEKKHINFDVAQLNIDRAILLESGTTVTLTDCKIKQNDSVFDNVFRGANLELDPLDYAWLPSVINPIAGIKIIGKGESSIEGCDINKKQIHPVTGVEYDMVGDWYGIRTHQISFAMADDIEISNISFTKTRGWCISFDVCTNLFIHDLNITSNVKNGDGIDLRSGCKNVRILRCKGSTSDDFIAMTALAGGEPRTYPTSTVIYSGRATLNIDAALKAADPTALWIENIEITDCEMGSTYHGIIMLSANGNQVKNILVSNIKGVQMGGSNPNALIYIYTGYGGGYVDNDLNNIRISNVVSDLAQFVVASNAKCDNVWLNKLVNVKYPSQVTDLDNPIGFTITNS